MLWQAFRKGKQFPTLRQRFGRDIPDSCGRDVIWIHAASVGEVKAARALARALKTPGSFLLVTTASATGQQEVKRSIPDADAIRFLPLDLSWILRKWARTLRPRMLVLIEGDVWYHLLRSVAQVGGKTALVSGRLSERSAARWRFAPFFAKKLYGQLDRLCMQSEEHAARIKPFVAVKPLYITGNLKLSSPAEAIEGRHIEHLRPLAIAITCTHAPEEEELLAALHDIDATLFLAPRHPERFEEVARLLQLKKIPFVRWSQTNKAARVVLVDVMGQLPAVYHHSALAIVAGSFSSRVGGHNLLEPCLQGVPVLFGPHTHNQKELAEYVLASGAGKQVTIATLSECVRQFARDPKPLTQAAQALSQRSSTVLEKTLQILTS